MTAWSTSIAQRARADAASAFLDCAQQFTHTVDDRNLAVLALLCKYARRAVPQPGSNAWCTLNKVPPVVNEPLRAYMQAHYEKVEEADAPMKGTDLLGQLPAAGVVGCSVQCPRLLAELKKLGYEAREQLNRPEHGRFRSPVWVRAKTA